MKNRKRLLTGPYLFWAVTFIIIPIVMIFYYGLTDDNYQFTLMNLAEITTPENLKALGLSLLLSFISTVICLILSSCHDSVPKEHESIQLYRFDFHPPNVDELLIAYTGMADFVRKKWCNQRRVILFTFTDP